MAKNAYPLYALKIPARFDRKEIFLSFFINKLEKTSKVSPRAKIPKRWQKNGAAFASLKRAAKTPITVDEPGLFTVPLATAIIMNAQAARITEI